MKMKNPFLKINIQTKIQIHWTATEKAQTNKSHGKSYSFYHHDYEQDAKQCWADRAQDAAEYINFKVKII